MDLKTINDNTLPLVRELYAAQESLNQAKQHFDDIRAQVVESLIDKTVPGTHNFKLSDEMKLTVTVPRTMDVEKELFKEQYSALMQRGLIGDSSVIQMKPSVSLTGYKYLTDEDKAQFGHIFKAKVGSPQVKFSTNKE